MAGGVRLGRVVVVCGSLGVPEAHRAVCAPPVHALLETARHVAHGGAGEGLG